MSIPQASSPQRSRASNLVHNHPVSSLFVLSYAVTWSLWAPLVVARDSMPGTLAFVLSMLGSMVPSAVAILLVGLMHGRRGVRKLLSRLLKGRVGLRYYLAVLLLPMVVPLGVGLNVVLGGRSPAVDATVASALFLFVFSIFPGSALGEELGWRGFALPFLQRDHSALGAGLFIGVFWGLWHFPLYLIGIDTRPLSIFPLFVLSVIATSVICTWLYNSTGGSLLIVVLYHAAANLPITLLFEPLGEHGARPFSVYLALLIVVTGAIVVTTGPAHLSRTQPKQIEMP